MKKESVVVVETKNYHLWEELILEGGPPRSYMAYKPRPNKQKSMQTVHAHVGRPCRRDWSGDRNQMGGINYRAGNVDTDRISIYTAPM